MHPPFLLGEGGGGGGRGLNLLQNFRKGGAWQDLNFERAAGKEGGEILTKNLVTFKR